MQWLSDFLFQAITAFLFVVALGFFWYFLAEKDQTKMLWSAFAAWVFMGAALAILLSTRVLVEPEFSGLLRPSDEPTPTLRIPIPPNALLVNLGGNYAFSTRPAHVVLRLAGEDVLSVERINGCIALNSRVYGPDGRVVAVIEKNKFTVNPNNFFKIGRPNRFTFIVHNQRGEEAMNVRFANPGHMVVTGTFHKPGYGVLTVTPSGIRSPRVNITGSILGQNAETDFAL